MRKATDNARNKVQYMQKKLTKGGGLISYFLDGNSPPRFHKV